MATIHRSDVYSNALAAAQNKYYGTFDTGLRCNCGDGHITDHATGRNPRAIPNPRFGSTPSWRERLDAFTVYHEYYCDRCGALYEGKVIERQYLPLEKRDPPPNSLQLISEAIPMAFRSEEPRKPE